METTTAVAHGRLARSRWGVPFLSRPIGADFSPAMGYYRRKNIANNARCVSQRSGPCPPGRVLPSWPGSTWPSRDGKWPSALTPSAITLWDEPTDCPDSAGQVGRVPGSSSAGRLSRRLRTGALWFSCDRPGQVRERHRDQPVPGIGAGIQDLVADASRQRVGSQALPDVLHVVQFRCMGRQGDHNVVGWHDPFTPGSDAIRRRRRSPRRRRLA